MRETDADQLGRCPVDEVKDGLEPWPHDWVPALSLSAFIDSWLTPLPEVPVDSWASKLNRLPWCRTQKGAEIESCIPGGFTQHQKTRWERICDVFDSFAESQPGQDSRGL